MCMSQPTPADTPHIITSAEFSLFSEMLCSALWKNYMCSFVPFTLILEYLFWILEYDGLGGNCIYKSKENLDF